ncbi:hypothetical protein FACS1894208_10550 [Clostridia bacterium]|nr:hypothetical protein FACS1894208_10550 [Clostridia bacterium]
MNTLTTQGVFKDSEFGELEVLSIDGKEYFPATACAKMLGYKNPKQAIIDHCKGVVKRDPIPSNSGSSKNFIPEGDLYRLIIRSKLPSAERFERWVMDEVLPTIRKRGAYAAPLDKNMSQVQLAKELGVTKNYITNIFTGHQKSEGLARRICEKLEVEYKAS